MLPDDVWCPEANSFLHFCLNILFLAKVLLIFYAVLCGLLLISLLLLQGPYNLLDLEQVLLCHRLATTEMALLSYLSIETGGACGLKILKAESLF